MKKKYIEPQMEPAAVDMYQELLVVSSGDSVHDEYNAADETYSREDLWSDEEDDFDMD